MKTDLDRLQGMWVVAALEMDGEKMAARMIGGARVVVKGERFQSLGMGAEYEGRLVLNEAASPKAFDLKFTKGPEKGNTALGIYQISGEQWKICLTTRVGAVERPKKFATKAGTGIALEILKRGVPAKAVVTKGVAKKGAAKSNAEDVDTGASTELEGEWKLVSGALDGKAMDAASVEWGRRVFRGGSTTLSFGPQVYQKARFTLDSTKSPGEIDYEHSQGMFAGKKQLGIYECDGKSLKLCASTPGSPRPKDFAAGKGRNVTHFMAVHKRE